MIETERENRLRHLAILIAGLVPSEREVALGVLRATLDLVRRLNADDSWQIALQVAAQLPSNKEDAMEVLDLATDLIDSWLRPGAPARMHSLRRVHGFQRTDSETG